jgi:hypothetical protein
MLILSADAKKTLKAPSRAFQRNERSLEFRSPFRSKIFEPEPPFPPHLRRRRTSATCSSSTESPSSPSPARCVCYPFLGARLREYVRFCLSDTIDARLSSCRGAAGGSSWQRSRAIRRFGTRPIGSRPRRRGRSRRGRTERDGTCTCSSGSTPRSIRRASRCVEMVPSACLMAFGCSIQDRVQS